MISRFLRLLVPNNFLALYHRTVARMSAAAYGFPSHRLLVIGVTGTTGKSTMVDFLAAIFRHAGKKVGVSSSIRFQIGEQWEFNATKMTMPGRGQLQRLLRSMVRSGCTVAIIETTSQGIAQHRHEGIAYDAAVITNITPEHIESHGSFTAYRSAKGQLFAGLSHSFRKPGIPKVSVVNLDSTEANYFSNFPADKHIGYQLKKDPDDPGQSVHAERLVVIPTGSSFTVDGVPITLQLPGRFNVMNALAAIAVASAYGISLTTIAEALRSVALVPGRFEILPTNTSFRVIVDYAHEPAGLTSVYELARSFTQGKLLAVLGAAGGGRDTQKREMLGRLAAHFADLVFVTNEDPYDDDPQEILRMVALGARQAGKCDGETLWEILDRREAIRQALSWAGEGDTVLITGKGSEQSMAVAGGRLIPWSDRGVVFELLGVEKPEDNPGMTAKHPEFVRGGKVIQEREKEVRNR